MTPRTYTLDIKPDPLDCYAEYCDARITEERAPGELSHAEFYGENAEAFARETISALRAFDRSLARRENHGDSAAMVRACARAALALLKQHAAQRLTNTDERAEVRRLTDIIMRALEDPTP